jgi:L-tartrate/succinate antiporter
MQPPTPLSIRKPTQWWRATIPVAVTFVLCVLPAPAGLPQHAWLYFAIFAGVIVALVFEPLPSPAVGVIGVTTVAVFSRWVLFTPEQAAAVEFDLPEESLNWALEGFASSTTWLVFSAFMFALAYEKTGLGRRIGLILMNALGRNSLTLGYAVVITETLLAPVTPSNAARSAGTIFPIIRNLPPLYDSLPNDESSRKMGGYLMWTTFATCCVTSSLFMTACAPNLLAVNIAKQTIDVDITWWQWFVASAPFTLPLLISLPVLVYLIYPPQVALSSQVPAWASRELMKMGALSRQEIILSLLILLAISLWIFGTRFIDVGTTGLMVIVLMLIVRMITWDEMATNNKAWSTLTTLATMVTLAGGLSKTGFIAWFAGTVAAHMTGFSPTMTLVGLITIYFLSHYMFASLTAHTSALLPVMLAVGMGIPGVSPEKLALGLALATGLMGVISPYATGPALVYFESGYIGTANFWRLGAIFGAIFLAALLLIGVPLLMVA